MYCVRTLDSCMSTCQLLQQFPTFPTFGKSSLIDPEYIGEAAGAADNPRAIQNNNVVQFNSPNTFQDAGLLLKTEVAIVNSPIT